MAKNFVQCGDVMTYQNTTEAAIESGDVVVVGNVIGIALGDIAINAEGELAMEGVWQLEKTAPLVIAQGDELFWNTTTKKVTKTATDKPIGTAFVAEISAATTVKVKLYENSANGFGSAANVAAIATVNGSDAGTTQTLANATKTTVNAILTALKGAGIMVAD